MPTRNLRPGSSLGEKAVIPFRDPLSGEAAVWTQELGHLDFRAIIMYPGGLSACGGAQGVGEPFPQAPGPASIPCT